MIKEIRVYDPFNHNKQDSILRKETDIISDFENPEFQQCIRDLNDTLGDLSAVYGCTRGIGLSAPQIGYSLAISAIFTKTEHYILVNPHIINHSETQKLFRVGCFSFYEYRALVKCYDSVTVECFDVNGNKKTITVEDDLALVFQHEIDHLHGVLSFDRMKNKEKDLFIPREKLFSEYVPIKNYGIIFSLRQKLHKVKVQSILQYYSFLFNYSYDFKNYVKLAVQKRKELVNIIMKYSDENTKILEAGCGTSSISIFLSRKGYEVECIDNNGDMLLLAQTMNQKLNGNARYLLDDIEKMHYSSQQFNIVFSHGVLEHFNNKGKIKIINEGLRVASLYIISVPTIWDISNNLIGDEILWTIKKWKQFFKGNGYKIVEMQKAYPTTPKLRKINKFVKVLPSGNVIFVIKKM